MDELTNLDVNTEIDNHERTMSIRSSKDRLRRSRSLTIGTAFGGITEIIMRGDDSYLWATFRQEEVAELIHQLAASIGCNLILKPRNDFSAMPRWDNSKSISDTTKDFDPKNMGYDGLPGSPGYSLYNPAGTNEVRSVPGGLGGKEKLPEEDDI